VLVERVGDTLLLGSLLSVRVARIMNHDVARAEAIANEQLALARRTGVIRNEVMALQNIATLLWLRGDPLAAAAVCDEAQRKWLPTVNPDTPSMGLAVWAALGRGEFDEAARLAEAGYRSVLGSDVQSGSLAAVARRDVVAIRTWVERAEEQRVMVGAAELDSWVTEALALAAVLDGQIDTARGLACEAIRKEVREDAPLWVLDAVEVLGIVEAAAGNVEAAGVCFGGSTAVRIAKGMLLSPLGSCSWVAEARATAEAADPEAFAAGWKRGEASPVADFLDLATELTQEVP
jgi:hypothetical protein